MKMLRYTSELSSYSHDDLKLVSIVYYNLTDNGYIIRHFHTGKIMSNYRGVPRIWEGGGQEFFF